MAAKHTLTLQQKKLVQHLKKHGKDRSWAELTQLCNPGAPWIWSRDCARLHCKFEYKKVDTRLASKAIPIDDQVKEHTHKRTIDLYKRSNKE